MFMEQTIHVIDDDEGVRESLLSLLDCYGFKAQGHPSAEAFLAFPRQTHDCVLVDHHMPGMTGLELLERLFSEGSCCHALMMTAGGSAEIAARAKSLGAKYLTKPVEANVLIEWAEQQKR